MITTTTELQALIERALATDSVGIDTEFFWERTYFPQLGLIQLAISNDDCHLIDPILIKDLSPIAQLLESPKTVKIFHDAPQDIALLQHVSGAKAVNIFDTQLAAGFCGLSHTLSLSSLLEELLDIHLAKTETRTNWLKRPLHEKQVAYALDDVRYLRAAKVVLLNRVYSPEVHTFLKEELQNFLYNNTHINIEDSQRYTRVKGCGSLNRKALAVLREITIHRENLARKKNRPRNHIIPDAVLLKIARNGSIEDDVLLDSGLSLKAFKQYGKGLKKAITKGLNCAKEDLPKSLKSPRLSKQEKINIKKLSTMIRLKSDTKGIDPAVVATNTEIKKYIKHLKNPEKDSNLRLLVGWRAQFLEEFLI